MAKQYDYEGLNRIDIDQFGFGDIEKNYEAYIGLSDIIESGDISKNKLSNILDTAISIVTKDGYIAYQIRGHRVSPDSGVCTSAVAENINRYLDDAKPSDSNLLINENNYEKNIDKIGNDYEPRCVPHPFATVRRGIKEELSPSLIKHILPPGILLTGLTFDLKSFHPNLLFMIYVNLTHQEIEKKCEEYPGKDYDEGNLGFIPATFDNDKVVEFFHNSKLTPGGAASIFRAIEILDSKRKKSNRFNF